MKWPEAFAVGAISLVMMMGISVGLVAVITDDDEDTCEPQQVMIYNKAEQKFSDCIEIPELLSIYHAD